MDCANWGPRTSLPVGLYVDKAALPREQTQVGGRRHKRSSPAMLSSLSLRRETRQAYEPVDNCGQWRLGRVVMSASLDVMLDREELCLLQ